MSDLDDIIFLDEKPVIKEGKRIMQKKTTKTKSVKVSSIGLDVGTGWICGAYHKTKTKIDFVPLRSCFYKIPDTMFSGSMFNLNTMKYVKQNDDVFIIGEDALTMAKIQNSKALRPLSKGTINPQEKSSAAVLKEMLRYCIETGNPEKGSNVVFSVPAETIGSDDESFNVEYHSMSISALIDSLGYKPTPLNEAYAVIISELQNATEVTGLGFSFGAGLVNVAFVYKGMLLFQFSINKSGDFIDKESARATGTSESMINHIKEHQLDLSTNMLDLSPEERALVFTHTHVIKNTIQQMIKTFNGSDNVNIIEPIPIVISGGTTLPNGFIELFKDELDKQSVPFEYTDIISAKDRLTAVSKGCLLMADTLG
jgi:hypothetical protein